MHRILAAAALAALLTACGLNDPKSERGFRLPDGDPEAGKKAFVDLGCYTCHEVEGIDAKFAGTGAANIKLGGETTIVRSYGELVAFLEMTYKVVPPPYNPYTRIYP